jgi:DNA invertase Pin-like site-specific DNA recombinase
MTIYGYARVSSDTQALASQDADLHKAGAAKVYREKVSRDLLNILDKISKAGASFKSLRKTWADTTTPAGRLMVTIIGGIAEFERELIRARTGDGITRAKAAGIHMGQPSKLSKHQQLEALARLKRGEDMLVEIVRSYAVSRMTLSRLKERHAAS